MKYPVLFSFFVFFITSSGHCEEPIVECKSKTRFSIKLEEESDLVPLNFTIEKSGNEISINYTSSEALSYNLLNQQFYWDNLSGKFLLKKKDGRHFYRIPRPGKTTASYPVPNISQDIINQLTTKKMPNFKEQVKKCTLIKTFREQLRTPMLPIEKQSCERYLKIAKQLHICDYEKDCKEAISSLENFSKDGETSFVNLFESNVTLTDTEKRLGKIMAIDSSISYSTPILMRLNKKVVAKSLAKVGLRFNPVLAFILIASSFSKPLLALIFGDDQCGDKGLHSNDPNQRNLEDCVGRRHHSLRSKFEREFLEAFDNPDAFLKKIGNSSDGRPGRLACYVFESMIDSWRENWLNYSNFTCQGRTITLKNGTTYLIGKKSSFYRNKGNERTYIFKPEGMSVLNRETGKSFTPIYPSDLPHYRKRENRIPQKELQSRMTPERIWQEKIMMDSAVPRFNEVIQNGRCIDQGSGDSEDQASEI